MVQELSIDAAIDFFFFMMDLSWYMTVIILFIGIIDIMKTLRRRQAAKFRAAVLQRERGG